MLFLGGGVQHRALDSCDADRIACPAPDQTANVHARCAHSSHNSFNALQTSKIQNARYNRTCSELGAGYAADGFARARAGGAGAGAGGGDAAAASGAAAAAASAAKGAKGEAGATAGGAGGGSSEGAGGASAAALGGGPTAAGGAAACVVTYCVGGLSALNAAAGCYAEDLVRPRTGKMEGQDGGADGGAGWLRLGWLQGGFGAGRGEGGLRRRPWRPVPAGARRPPPPHLPSSRSC